MDTHTSHAAISNFKLDTFKMIQTLSERDKKERNYSVILVEQGIDKISEGRQNFRKSAKDRVETESVSE
jgi:hypothetical protein